MRCPLCNTTFSFGNICPHCGTDAELYARTRQISDRMYNKGLALAKAGELTEAILALKESITFDKVQVRARNLLGLTYYETGRIGDALMQWIISASLIHENNPANRYIASLQRNGRQLEQLNDAVRMYNHAISYMRQRSEDLALIQLKKAVDINPKFIEALNLLTLCYIQMKNFSQAKVYVDKVLELDKNNRKALFYARELHYSTTKAKTKETIQIVPEKEIIRAQTVRMPEKKKTVIGGSEIIAFVIGIICTTAVLITLVLPAWADGKDATIRDLEGKLAKYSEELDVDGTMKTKEELLKEITDLKTQLENYKTQASLQDTMSKMERAAELAAQENACDAALLLSEIDSSTLPEGELARFEELKQTSYPKATRSFYDAGKVLFLGNNYEEALKNFENSLKFASDEDIMDDAIYYLGNIAESKGETEKARAYYERIIQEYPDSNQLKKAQSRMDAL